MNTVHMNGYDIDIRIRPDGQYDVSQHCTNGRIGASRMILKNEDELNAYLTTKGLTADVFEKEGDTTKSDIDVKPDENGNGAKVTSAYAKLVTIFPFLAPNKSGSLVSKGADVLASNGIHDIDDVVDAYKEFDDDLTQVLLPRPMRKDQSDEDFNRRLNNLLLPRAYRKEAA